MELKMPSHLREEQKRLLYLWYDTDEGLSLEDYTKKYGSKELNQYYEEVTELSRKYMQQGIIVN